MTSTAVARQARAAVTGPIFGSLPEKVATPLEQARAAIEPYLPRGIDFQSVISDVFLATRKNADLLNCDPESLVMAVVEVQQRGLRIGSTCHLVPKGGKVCAWNDIRGDVEMIVRSGACRDVTANVVYQHEPFTYAETATGPEMRHEIITDPEQRGAIKGAYARFWLGGTRYMVKYLTLAEVEVVRAGSLSWNPKKVAKCPPWYLLKTVIRQGAKYLPKNKNLVAVYAAFDRDAAVDTEPTGPRAAFPSIVDSEGETIDTTTGEILEQSGAADTPASAIEAAKAMPFPFQKGKPLHGRPMGELPTELLSNVAGWIVEKQDEKNDPTFHQDTIAAINLIVADREKDQTTLGLEEPPLDSEEPASVSPPGSKTYVVPPPGKIEDALELNDRRAQPNRNALSEP